MKVLLADHYLEEPLTIATIISTAPAIKGVLDKYIGGANAAEERRLANTIADLEKRYPIVTQLNSISNAKKQQLIAAIDKQLEVERKKYDMTSNPGTKRVVARTMKAMDYFKGLAQQSLAGQQVPTSYQGSMTGSTKANPNGGGSDNSFRKILPWLGIGLTALLNR